MGMSGAAPTNPLFLQVAMKNSLDIFYFNVPFDFSVVLMEQPVLNKEQFTQIWQSVGEQSRQVFAGNTAGPFTDEAVRSRLALDNVHYVAKRNVDDMSTFIYFGATTTSNAVVCGEIS